MRHNIKNKNYIAKHFATHSATLHATLVIVIRKG